MDSIVRPIEEAVSRYGPRPAVVAEGGETWTYATLWERVTDREAELRRLGVVPGDRVALLVPKCPDAIAVLLAILKRGAVAVPLDPHWPAPRVERIVQDCAPRLLLHEKQWHHLPPSLPAPAGASVLFYTSGSTGLPKGVLHSHLSMESFLTWAEHAFQPNTEDRFCSYAGLHFDLSVLDIYLPLRHGASVLLWDRHTTLYPARCLEQLGRHRPTFWYSTPTALIRLLQYGKPKQGDLDSVRTICFAGEVFPRSPLRQLRQLAPRAEMWNLYGPTETNVCSAHRLPPSLDAGRQPVPVGQPIGDFEFSLDENSALHVRGSGTMVGYWGAPALTSDQWYPTGDRLEKRGGLYHFLGRLDSQIKLFGQRIEPAEIETALLEHPSCKQAVAGLGPGPRLVAFYTGPLALRQLDLKKHCAQRLPSAMVPARFYHRLTLPLTSTGKLDRKQLFDSLGDPAAHVTNEPSEETERPDKVP